MSAVLRGFACLFSTNMPQEKSYLLENRIHFCFLYLTIKFLEKNSTGRPQILFTAGNFTPENYLCTLLLLPLAR